MTECCSSASADWRISELEAQDNTEYAIFPSHSFNGRVDHSFASDARDTGFYIGQSFNSRMDHNVATGNVSGYEIENSIGVKADHNVAHDNTGGILSFTLPFLDAKVNSGNVITHNVVRNNNQDNNCGSGPGLRGTVRKRHLACGRRLQRRPPQPGDGQSLLRDRGGEHLRCAAAFASGSAISSLQDIDPSSDNNHIVHNTVLGNGARPIPCCRPSSLWIWPGIRSGTAIAWSKNVFGTSFPPDLPSC